MIFEKMTNAEIEALHNKDSKSFVDYLKEEYDFYKSRDGLVIEIEKANKKPIDKIIWYDDEMEAPKLNLELFIEYNNHHLTSYDFGHKIAFFGNNISYDNICYITNYREWEKKSKPYLFKYFKRDLTPGEIEELKVLSSYYNNLYLERLKNYYKRFNKYIRVNGYWANR